MSTGVCCFNYTATTITACQTAIAVRGSVCEESINIFFDYRRQMDNISQYG